MSMWLSNSCGEYGELRLSPIKKSVPKVSLDKITYEMYGELC